MAIIKCPECGKKISDKSTVCIHCGYPLNPVDIQNLSEIKEKSSKSNIKRIKKANISNKNKKIFILVASVISFIIVDTSISIPVGIHFYYDKLYKEIESEALNFDYGSIKKIKKNLEQLPDSYEKIEIYNKEFNIISKEMYYLDAICNDFDDSLLARKAFKDLSSIHDSLRWDLSKILKTSDTIRNCLFGVLWEYSDFKFYLRHENGNETLTTNLPNGKDPNESYYFYEICKEDYYEIGFSNRNKNEEFPSFLFSNLQYYQGSFYVYCKCYENNTTYRLSYDE